MKKVLIIFIILFGVTRLFSQAYEPIDADSDVKFTIKNFGLNVTGSFKGLKGKIIFDPANTASALFDVSVDARTVYTGNESRDKHLKKDEYLDVERYPTLSFVTTRIVAFGMPGVYKMEGELIIKGIKKAVSFPFTATPTTKGYRLKGQFKVNRRDFKVGASSWVLSDDLIVILNVSVIK